MMEIKLPRIDSSIEKADFTDMGSREQFVFVYLMYDDNPISFWKGSLSQFFTTKCDYKWLTLKRDSALNKIDSDHKAGLVSLKMQIVKNE